MKLLRGLTLAELIVTMLIISTIAIVTVPLVKKTKFMQDWTTKHKNSWAALYEGDTLVVYANGERKTFQKNPEYFKDANTAKFTPPTGVESLNVTVVGGGGGGAAGVSIPGFSKQYFAENNGEEYAFVAPNDGLYRILAIGGGGGGAGGSVLCAGESGHAGGAVIATAELKKNDQLAVIVGIGGSRGTDKDIIKQIGILASPILKVALTYAVCYFCPALAPALLKSMYISVIGSVIGEVAPAVGQYTNIAMNMATGNWLGAATGALGVAGVDSTLTGIGSTAFGILSGDYVGAAMSGAGTATGEIVQGIQSNKSEGTTGNSTTTKENEYPYGALTQERQSLTDLIDNPLEGQYKIVKDVQYGKTEVYIDKYQGRDQWTIVQEKPRVTYKLTQMTPNTSSSNNSYTSTTGSSTTTNSNYAGTTGTSNSGTSTGVTGSSGAKTNVIYTTDPDSIAGQDSVLLGKNEGLVDGVTQFDSGALDEVLVTAPAPEKKPKLYIPEKDVDLVLKKIPMSDEEKKEIEKRLKQKETKEKLEAAAVAVGIDTVSAVAGAMLTPSRDWKTGGGHALRTTIYGGGNIFGNGKDSKVDISAGSGAGGRYRDWGCRGVFSCKCRPNGRNSSMDKNDPTEFQGTAIKTIEKLAPSDSRWLCWNEDTNERIDSDFCKKISENIEGGLSAATTFGNGGWRGGPSTKGRRGNDGYAQITEINAYGGGGGAAGAISTHTFTKLPQVPIEVIVGKGGNGGLVTTADKQITKAKQKGQDGGFSSFGSKVIASGGAGGELKIMPATQNFEKTEYRSRGEDGHPTTITQKVLDQLKIKENNNLIKWKQQFKGDYAKAGEGRTLNTWVVPGIGGAGGAAYSKIDTVENKAFNGGNGSPGMVLITW